jgi:hypothetical protein
LRRFLAVCVSTIVLPVASGPTAIAQETEADSTTEESGENVSKKTKHQTPPESARTTAQPPAKADSRGHKKVKHQQTPKSHQEGKTGQAKK